MPVSFFQGHFAIYSCVLADLYRLCLTDQIVEEMRRNLVENKHMTEAQGRYLVQEIKKSFSDAFEVKYVSLIPDMPVNEKDRHVLAAAVASESQSVSEREKGADKKEKGDHQASRKDEQRCAMP
jgi:hypothetical protein